MVALNDIRSYLDKLKDSGYVMDWRIVQDTGEKVVIYVEYVKPDDMVESENYILLIKDRNTPNEKVYWKGKKIRVGVESILEQTFGNKKKEIFDKLKENYNMKIMQNYRVDDKSNCVWVNTYCETENNVLSMKMFAVVFDEDGGYVIYEVK